MAGRLSTRFNCYPSASIVQQSIKLKHVGNSHLDLLEEKRVQREESQIKAGGGGLIMRTDIENAKQKSICAKVGANANRKLFSVRQPDDELEQKRVTFWKIRVLAVTSCDARSQLAWPVLGEQDPRVCRRLLAITTDRSCCEIERRGGGC